MSDVFLMLGSNLGNRFEILSKALLEIEATIGSILRKSSIYETQSWGYKDEKKYLNQLVIVSTKLSPDEVLHCAHIIEKKFGRVRHNYYTARCIDIDILFYDEIILKTEALEIPHPRLHLRRFVLAPCNEIAPEFIHPAFQKTIHQLYNICNDKLFVKKIDYKKMGNNQQYIYCKDIINTNKIKTKEICVGKTSMGGENPVRVQTMTNTKTTDIQNSVEQIKRTISSGAEYVRLSVPSIKDIQAFKDIKQELVNQDISVPLIADVHFNRTIAYKMLSIADKVRINPGNFIVRDSDDKDSTTDQKDLRTNLEPFLKECKKQNKAIRIGVNHGSLDKHIVQKYGDTPLGMAESAWEYIQLCRHNDFHQIVISIKASNTKIMVYAVRLLVHKMITNNACYPIHLGVTEAGSDTEGRIKSAIGIGSLLKDGIGDTIRVSLTEDPEFEIPVAKKIIAHIQQQDDLLNSLDNVFYSPYEYNKTRTIKFQNFGGDNPPQVIIHVDSHLREKNIDPVIFGYNKENEEWIKTNQAADCIYIDSVLSLDNLPDQLNVLIDYKYFIEYKQKPNNLIPVYSVSEFMEEQSFHTNSAFIKVSINTINDEVLQKVNQHPIGIIIESETTNRIGEFRYIFSLLDKFNIKSPVILSVSYQISDDEQFIVSSSIDFGSLLIDGFGDGIMITNPDFNDTEKLIDLHFNILQASGSRIFKTEYISCPGCARTMFDLQKTTKLIKEKTSHLKGIKIAVMGCIVNGPGEMADADYGYIGSGNGNVNLYKGKTLMKKNIAEEKAVNELLMLINNQT